MGGGLGTRGGGNKHFCTPGLGVRTHHLNGERKTGSKAPNRKGSSERPRKRTWWLEERDWERKGEEEVKNGEVWKLRITVGSQGVQKQRKGKQR